MFRPLRLLVTLLFAGIFHQLCDASIVDPHLVASLFEKDTVNIFISFHEQPARMLSSLKNQSFSSRPERLNAVATTLRKLATQSQSRVLSFLDEEKQQRARGISVESFWITNQVFVKNANPDLVHRLQKMSEISKIHEERVFKMDDPILTNGSGNLRQENLPPRWGAEKIQAPALWEQGITGQGIVIGSIDTGVRHTHDELRDNFVGPYGWFDPGEKSAIPSDEKGHGTHVAGTHSGNGPQKSGIAPGSKWMACKGCPELKCVEGPVIACGQFMACPTDTEGNNPDCSKAPHVVSNSWGFPGYPHIYDPVIDAWHAAGIVPVFAIGNGAYEDNKCGKAASPGDHENVIGVGATYDSDSLAFFSRLGPSQIGQRIKPDVCAPGYQIYSGNHKGDDSYELMTGTSMATPHVAGVVALLLSENGNLAFSEIKSALEQGCAPVSSKGRPTCNGNDGTTFPNYHSGYGRIDAVKSLEVIRKMYPK